MIGAYNYCFNQPTATYYALKNFRKIYQDSTIVVHNDGGMKIHEDIAKHFNANYTYHEKNITGGNNVHDIEIMVQWLERFFNAVELIKEDWFMLLEDDVYILNEVDESKLNYEINGINDESKNYFPVQVGNYLKEFRNDINENQVKYSACGGCIFKTEFFRKIATLNWKEHMYKYGVMCKVKPGERTWFFNDCVVSFLALVYGGNIGNYEGYYDLNISRPTINDKITVVHQFRNYYNIPFNNSLLNNS